MFGRRMSVFLMLGVGMAHAQRWQVGDFDTLWYYDEATRRYIQGVFRVEAVTPHFYIMSEQRPVESVEKLFGLPGMTPFGIVVDGTPYYFNGPEWVAQGLYSNLMNASPSDIRAYVLGGDTVVVVSAGVRVGLAPSGPGQNWATRRVKVLPEQIVSVAVAPAGASSAASASVFAAGQGHLFRAPLTGVSPSAWADTFFAVRDLFVSDFFTPVPPYADTDLVAQGWQISGTVTWDRVLVGGRWFEVIRASSGAVLTKNFALPLPMSRFSAKVRVLSRQGDAFAFRFEDAQNEAVFALRAAQGNLTLDLPDTTLSLASLGSLREVFLVEWYEADGAVVVRLNGREIFRGAWNAQSVSSPVRVRASVSAGELILESVDVTVLFTSLASLPSAEGVLVGTPVGLFRYSTSGGWSTTGFKGSVDRVVTFLQNPGFVGVISGGTVHTSTDGGATFTPMTMPAGDLEIRDIAFSPTNPAEAIVATQRGFFHTTDGGRSWRAAFPYLAQLDPEPWVQDARGVIWDGGQRLLVHTLGGLFYSEAGLDSLKEWDYSGLDPYFVYPSQLADLRYILEDSVFTLEPDSGVQVPAQGLFEAVRQVLGDPGQDLDGDPRVVLLLTNLRYQLPPGANGAPDRVPFFESVNPLTWTRSSFANRHEVIVLDNAHLDGDAFAPINFKALETSNPQAPHGFNAVVRALAKYFIYTHNLNQPRWIVEAVARYVEYAVRTGEANADNTLTAFPSDPELGLTGWPATWKLPPTRVRDTRNFKYVFLQYLREKYPNFRVRDLVAFTGGDGRDYIQQITGKTLGQLFREFATQVVFDRLVYLPNISYSFLGLSPKTIQPLAPFTFIARRAQAGRNPLLVDTLWINGLPGDPVEYAVYHRFATGDSLRVQGVVNVLGDAVLVLNDTIRQGEALIFLLLWAEGDSGARMGLGQTTVRAWYSTPSDGFAPAPVFSHVLLQDPLLETRVNLYGFVSTGEPIYAELPGWVAGTENPLGLGIREVEPQDFGMVDTSFRAVLPVASPYISGGQVFEYITNITARGKELYLFARDSLGRPVVDTVEQLQFLTLTPGVAVVHEMGDLRVEIPEGAVRETRRILVRSFDGSNPALLASQQFPVPPRRVIQVGSAYRLDREAEITLAHAPDVEKAWVLTQTGWEEIPVEKVGDGVRLYTRHLGLIALADGASSPALFQMRFLSPVIRTRQSLQFEVVSPQEGQANLTVLDPLGRRVMTRTLGITRGYQRIQIPVPFAPGIYFLKVRVDDHILHERVVVLP